VAPAEAEQRPPGATPAPTRTTGAAVTRRDRSGVAGSTLSGTSACSTPSRGRGLVLGATAVVTVGLVSASASVIGAQTARDPIRTEIVSVDDDGVLQDLPVAVVSAMSDTGGVVVYETSQADTFVDPATAAPPENRRVWVRDRIGGTARAVAETGSVAPGVSGNGCVVAYTVVAATDATLTAVDRCVAPVESPLPIGTVIDSVAFDTPAPEEAPDTPETEEAQDTTSQRTSPVSAGPDDPLVAAPSLSFDGSTIVWSTGREIRRYVRPAAGGAHLRTHTFDTVASGSPDVVTGAHTDVSADGRTVVFVAGPGVSPFEPTPANVYAWTSTTPQVDAELVSATSSGDPAPADSTAPTITADGSYVVFESSSLDLPVAAPSSVVAPFVVGVDLAERTGRILVDDADRPTVSADGRHVVYRRGDAIRVLSSDATSTTDHPIDELAEAGPIGAMSISQFGRWIVFAGTVEPPATPPGGPVTDGSSDTTGAARAVWAVDRASSSPDVVDTTTTTMSPTKPPTPTPPTTVPVPEVVDPSTVPATASPPAVTVPRFPTVTSRFPRVGFPPPRPVARSFPRVDADSGAVVGYAAPVTFDPTVVDAGRRTQPVILTNVGARTLRVASAALQGPGAFTLVGDTCTGSSVAPGSTCSVEVRFAPGEEGSVTATVTFRLADGSLVTALVAGTAVPAPTLDLVPAVAGAGQTVTLFGAGFPPGAAVELSRPGTSTIESITVDVDGTFAHVIVVLPNTAVGSSSLSVDGQPDVFGDVAVELVVSNRRATSADAALRGGPAGPLGP
jgi:hypothetical protein